MANVDANRAANPGGQRRIDTERSGQNRSILSAPWTATAGLERTSNSLRSRQRGHGWIRLSYTSATLATEALGLEGLGRYQHEAVLGEVTVEAERRPDIQSLHHRKADGVGERELLVGVAKDDLLRPHFIRCTNADDNRIA